MDNISLDDMFRTHKVLNASDKELEQMLTQLCGGHIENWMVIHREVIRGLTINHIQMQRHIDKLDKRSSTLQKWVIALAIASLIGTAVQTYTTLFPLAL